MRSQQRAPARGEVSEEVTRDRNDSASWVQDVDQMVSAPRDLGPLYDGHGAPPHERRRAPTLSARPPQSESVHIITEQLFGICALLGIEFMPRLKDLADQVLYRIDRDADYGALDPVLRGSVNLDLIAEQWDQLVRIVASLQDRTAPADVVLQRLINAAPADRLAKALTALGSLVKTIHILRYIHHAPLRQAIQLQLNRGEFRHIVAKWLFFANQGDFRVGDYEEIMNKASCLSLLSNAVLVWNTVHIARIVAQRRAGGHEVRDEDLARVSPLLHAHTVPSGSYFQSPRRRSDLAPVLVTA